LAEIWMEFWEAVEDHYGPVTIRKVKAHKSIEEVLLAGGSPIDWIGNHLADRLAGWGAALHEIPAVVIDDLKIKDAMTWKIQKRLIACYQGLLACKPTADEEALLALWKQIDEHKEAFRPLLELRKCGHAPTRVGKTLKCKLCLRSCPFQVKRIKSWIQEGCCRPVPKSVTSGIAPDSVVPGRANENELAGGIQHLGSIVHPSHRIGRNKGVVWCWDCKCFAAHKVKLLARPCTAPEIRPAPQRVWQVSRLQQGLEPYAGFVWPVFASSDAEGGIIRDPMEVDVPVPTVDSESD